MTRPGGCTACLATRLAALMGIHTHQPAHAGAAKHTTVLERLQADHRRAFANYDESEATAAGRIWHPVHRVSLLPSGLRTRASHLRFACLGSGEVICSCPSVPASSISASLREHCNKHYNPLATEYVINSRSISYYSCVFSGLHASQATMAKQLCTGSLTIV